MHSEPRLGPLKPTTMVVFDTIEYNIVEDMKKSRANISIHELTKLKQKNNVGLRGLLAQGFQQTPILLAPLEVTYLRRSKSHPK